MNKILLYLFTILFLLSSLQCTSTRWTVSDLNAIDDSDQPERIDSRKIIQIGDSATVERPFLNLRLYEIHDYEYTERVLVERTVQQYRPRWGFTFLGSLGAAIAFYAGNTDGFIENTTVSQTIALNSAGVLLTAMAFTNMKPVGDPIQTGETKFLRQSGSVVIPDTTLAEQTEGIEISVRISYDETVKFSESYNGFDGNELNVNLAGLLADETLTGNDPGELDVDITFQGEIETYKIPVSSIMTPVVVVNSPVAELRNQPVYTGGNTFTEVGNGSELILLNQSDDQWYEVRFGGSEVFILRESGEIQWKAADIISDPTIITVDEVPFGDLSVEYSVPVLKQRNNQDYGLILTNHQNNQIGVRRYLERDYRMVELYYRDAFGVSASNLHRLTLVNQYSYQNYLNNLQSDTSSVIHVYIGGFARVTGDESDTRIELIHIDDNDEVNVINLEELLTDLASLTSKKLIVFIDLSYREHLQEYVVSGNNNGVSIYRQISESVQELNQNSALIFSARPDQKSGIYESVRFEQNYHHIFTYYLAQGLQQRRTILSNLVRYIENQVDYTSRRLHDRPQTIQAFGNLTINLSD